MPSFLADENSPVHSQSSGAVHLDPASEYGFSHEKINGQLPHPSQPHASNDTFDESSSHTTHSTNASDTRPHVTGGSSSRPPSMNTLPNGRPGGGPGGGTRPESGRKPLPNGTNSLIVDRTAPYQQLSNGTREGDPPSQSQSPSPSLRDAHPRTSLSSGAGGSIQQSPVEMYIRTVNKGDVTTVDSLGPSQTSLSPNAAPAAPPAASLTSLTTTNPSPDPNQRTGPPHSPHRFSSPPVYHSAGATPTSSTPVVGVTQSGLKHRHTLEVPKAAPARGSRDGLDTALTTGRFSPTTATAPGARRASLSLVRRNTRSLHSDLPRDEIIPDEDALRWAEAYRQKRASKRKKREEVDDDRVLVGTKVDENHANWVTAYNMLTGIRVSVSRTNAKLDRPLTDADFEAKQKSTFDIAGNELVPSAKYDFKFKDYAPWVFRHLRSLFRLDPADYLMSLTGKYILSELGSPGKSGSFFYFSRDYKYIIKTIHHGEHKFLRKILKEYYQHVIDNPNTLLSQFYGLHRVKMPYGKKIHFVVMNNLFPPHRDIHETFDLKGSTVGRDYKEEDLERNPRGTLKDLNWLRRQKHLEMGLEKKRLFLEQLQKDVRLLQRLEIMDYSLLVGIHDIQRGNEENLRDKTLQVFNPGGDVAPEDFDPHSVLMRTPSKLENARKARELRQMIKAERPVPMGQTRNILPNELEEGQTRPGFVFNSDDGGFRATHEDNTPADEIYYLGVIDCLTHYGIIKKIEHFWKGLSHDSTQISALAPDQYGERFMKFITATTVSPEEVARQVREKDAAAAAAAERERERMSIRGSTRRRSTIGGAPPAPTYHPPPPPVQHPLESGHKSPEAEETIQRAEQVARKTEGRGVREEDIPDRILKTTATMAAPATPSAAIAIKQHQGSNGPLSERRESTIAGQTPVLPVVEEAGEASSLGTTDLEGGPQRSISRTSRTESDGRPLTPAKDGEEMDAGFGNPVVGSINKGRPPPTPPKTGYLKPESADSGYGVTGGLVASASSGSQRSAQSPSHIRSQVSRESMDKALPPLPKVTQRIEDGEMVIRVGIS